MSSSRPRRLAVRLSVCTLAFSALVSGCSSAAVTADGGATADAGASTEGGALPPVSSPVSAAKGGTIRLDGATLTIPPNALAADTTITATARPATGVPQSDSLRSKVFDFGPNGLKFLVPATLAIDVAPDKAASVVVATLDETSQRWAPLDSKASAGSVSASLTHFSSYALVLQTTNAQLSVDFSQCKAPLPGKDGVYGDTCSAGAVKGRIDDVKLPGAPGSPYASNTCTVRYANGELVIDTNVPLQSGAGFLKITTKLNGDREDTVLARAVEGESGVFFVHMHDFLGGVSDKTARSSIWISDFGVLTYAYGASPDGTVICGSDARASD